MKKVYIKPSVETYEMNLNNQILAGSDFSIPGETTGNDITLAGKGHSGFDIWDDEDYED